MFFDVFLNDQKVATVGPSELEHLSVSLSGHKGDLMLMANGLLAAEVGQRYFTWLEAPIGPNDVVRIAPSKENKATEPQKVRNLRRGQKASKQDLFCDFCKRPETEAGRIIQAGDTPFICVRCAELCLEIAKGP
jgi:hypothetical protein